MPVTRLEKTSLNHTQCSSNHLGLDYCPMKSSNVSSNWSLTVWVRIFSDTKSNMMASTLKFCFCTVFSPYSALSMQRNDVKFICTMNTWGCYRLKAQWTNIYLDFANFLGFIFSTMSIQWKIWHLIFVPKFRHAFIIKQFSIYLSLKQTYQVGQRVFSLGILKKIIYRYIVEF